ncbi:MAG: thrombospondin type 3 repeat-containing protein [Chloroflexota bacterium]
MRYFRLILPLLLLFLLAFHTVSAQEPDADGDGIPDSQDFCWLIKGTADFHGCNADSFPDFDQDGVGDPVDSCVNQSGPAENSGCPVGITPDVDLDGVPDAQDTCPREAGSLENKGCPPDADSDGIPDQSDACPTNAGSGNNLGCPDTVRPLDSDGDSVPDLLDACPQDSGSTDLGGCPDRDSDGVPDSLDSCPDQAGQSDLFGCAPVTTTTLPANLTAITSANAASVAEAGRLVVGIPRIGLAAGGNTLAVRSSDDLLTYDLSAALLTPVVTVNTGWSGYPIAISQDAKILATLEFPPDFSTPPFVQIRDGASGAPLYQIASQPDGAGNPLAISTFVFNPVLPLLAVAETSSGGYTSGTGTPVTLWDVLNNKSMGQLQEPNIVLNLAFSGDGTKLAADSADGDSMVIDVWDVGTQSRLTSFKTTQIFHFLGTPMALNGDGSRVAVGYPDGSFSLWQTADGNGAQQYNVQLFDKATSEVVSAIAISPDGAVIAVAGGVPFSGGLSGQEKFPIFLLDAATGATLAKLDGHGSLIHDLAFSHDGRLLISAGDSSVKFWGVSG